MGPPQSTPTKKKKSSGRALSTSSPSSSPSSKTRQVQVAAQSTQKPSTGSGKAHTSPNHPRREQDTSYLQRPTVPKPSIHPVLPPSNAMFERPGTRSHSSPVPIKLFTTSGTEGSSRISPKRSISSTADKGPASKKLLSARVADQQLEQVQWQEQEQEQIQEQEQQERAVVSSVDRTVPPQEDGAGEAVATIDAVVDPDRDSFAVESGNITPSKATDSTSSALTPVSNPALAIVADIDTDEQPKASESAVSSPSSMATDSARTMFYLEQEAPRTIPAQIAFVNASPSKRVAFSPNKQESRLSSPNTTHTNRLRGILKPAPLRLGEVSEPAIAQDDAADGHRNEFDPYVTTATLALATEDLQSRTAAYVILQGKFRRGDDRSHMTEIRETIRTFASYLIRDLDPSNPPSLIQVALKSTGYYLYQPHIVVLFTSKETESLLNVILRLVNTTKEKLIQAFSENLDSRFKSLSVMNESLLGLYSIFTQFPGEILPHIQMWFIPVVMRLVYSVPGIRSKTLELVMTAIPKDVTFLFNYLEVYAMTVWGTMVTLFGRQLQKSSALNPMLKMAEKCFNSMSSRRMEIKMAAFQAWTRLIYNFAIGGYIASEKPLRLILKPIQNWWVLAMHADLVLFSQLKVAIVDESEHVRDLTLRLIISLFSNAGGQDLMEGRESIAPGSITFAHLGIAEAAWVRTVLLDQGLQCMHQTLCYQHKIEEAGREEWKSSGLTGLPLMSQRCAKAWESIVRAVRDLNVQEKELTATAEAGRALSALLLFIHNISRCDPNVLVPNEWPDSDKKEIGLLKKDPSKTGFILRADIVHYLYVCVVEIFSVRTLVTSRYVVLDKLRGDLQDALRQDLVPVSQTSDVLESQIECESVTLTPIEFILKCWLETGESVIATAFETPFWQAVATLVDMSKSRVRVLQALYKCLDHMEDVNAKRGSTSKHIWSQKSYSPAPPLLFREFQSKYWSIIAQRLGNVISELNELSEDASPAGETGYRELFSLMIYPFSILQEPGEVKRELLEGDHSQKVQESQDEESTEQRIHFIERFKSISMPTWGDLLRIFYRVAQHKRSNANQAMNILASQIRQCYDVRLPFVWGFDDLLDFCSFLFEEAYNNVDKTNESMARDQIPAVQEAAFLLIEKTMNKAPASLVIDWTHSLQHSIIHWMDDPLLCIHSSRPYRNRVKKLWIDCILPRLLSCSQEDINGAPKTAFGSVLAPHVSTIRGAAQQALQAQSAAANGKDASSPITATTLANPFLEQSNESYNTKTLKLLAPLLFVGLNSRSQSIVNSTIEFWNKSFGKSKSDLEYPEELVPVIRQMKLVATISLPGWTFEDSSQTEIPEFASSSISQDALSVPAELMAKSGLSRLLKQKAELAAQLTPSTRNKRILQIGIETLGEPVAAIGAAVSGKKSYANDADGANSPGENDTNSNEIGSDPGGNNAGVTNVYEGINSGASSAHTSRAATPTPTSTPTGSRIYTPGVDSDASVPGTPKRKSRKRKKKTVHSLAIDPVTNTIIAQTNEAADSCDEVEASTPTKKSRKVNIKKEPLPAPPLWRLQPPLKPYDPAEDLSSPIRPASYGFEKLAAINQNQEEQSLPAVGAVDEADDHPATGSDSADSEVDVFMEAPTEPFTEETIEAPTTPNAETTSAIQVSTSATALSGFRGETLSEGVYFTADSEEARDTLGSGSRGGGTESLPKPVKAAPLHSMLMDVKTIGGLEAGSSTAISKDAAGVIETGDEFAMALQHLVEARSVVGQMDIRQLFEVQNQLMTLSQAVHGEWGRILQNDAKDQQSNSRNSISGGSNSENDGDSS
ncbi:DNA-binding protein rif1 [Dissophora globulifera]|nr:DNA-binding protein rif1 [Dissophora globulifera]